MADLAATFTDPELGGFAEEHCRTVPADADLPRKPSQPPTSTGLWKSAR
ncbi:hypothetical protein [Streptomyces sp. NPDC029003]